MFSKRVSRAVKERTIENMEVYGMSLHDSFEEAARSLAKKEPNFTRRGIIAIFADSSRKHTTKSI